jgi:arsenite-transporting ATPase
MKTLTPFIRLTNKHKMFLLSIITLLLSSRTSYSFRLQPTSQRSGVTQSSILHRLSSHCPLPSPLFSLNDLIEDISSNDSRIVFVGGKGGVGKTSISSALAVELASSITHDRRVLVVSTDPAHSLGDALDVDLRSAEGDPVLLTDALTRGNLFACEIDPNKALESFQQTLSAFDIDTLANSLGVSPSLLESLGLREFSGLLNNPPPGLDELVALSNIFDKSMSSSGSNFDVVIVDTAPTGHTLRLLALPTFLDGLLGKLIELRLKLSGIASTLQGLFGNASNDAMQKQKTLDNALNKLESFRTRISSMRSQLQDRKKTNFLVVTVPTVMGVAETERLIKELNSQGVSVTDVVVNQCVIATTAEGINVKGELLE